MKGGEDPERAEDAAVRCAAIDESRDRSRAANAAQVTLVATFVALCYALMSLPGQRMLQLLAALYSAMLALYDARPDIGERLFPELWRQPRPASATPMEKRHRGRGKRR